MSRRQGNEGSYNFQFLKCSLNELDTIFFFSNFTLVIIQTINMNKRKNPVLTVNTIETLDKFQWYLSLRPLASVETLKNDTDDRLRYIRIKPKQVLKNSQFNLLTPKLSWNLIYVSEELKRDDSKKLIFLRTRLILFKQESSKAEMQSPFIKKLHDILQNERHSDAVSWVSKNTVIQIRDQENFSKNVLPKYFRHNKMSSFIRQLNLYGFKKLRSAKAQSFTHPSLLSGKSLQQIVCAKKMEHLPIRNRQVQRRAPRTITEERIPEIQELENENRNSQLPPISTSSGTVNEQTMQPQRTLNQQGYYWCYNPSMQPIFQNGEFYFACFI